MSNNNNIGALPSAALAPQEGLSPEAGSQAKQPAANAGRREVQRLRSLAADHYRNARRLAFKLVQANDTIEQLRKERVQ